MDEIIKYYDSNNEIQTISYKQAIKEWGETYESKREFLREVREARPDQLELGFLLVFEFLEYRYYATIPQEGDPNFQPEITNSNVFINNLRDVINEMGPVYDINPNFLKQKKGTGCLVQIALFISTLSIIFFFFRF